MFPIFLLLYYVIISPILVLHLSIPKCDMCQIPGSLNLIT